MTLTEPLEGRLSSSPEGGDRAPGAETGQLAAPAGPSVRHDAAVRPLELVRRLCATLQSEGVRYCHWKSNEALDRSAAGENDLDLLVSRRDAQRFAEVLRRLGFKEAVLPPAKQLPGVFHAYGFDQESGRLVHVHAHHQLVLGDDMTKNYRLPVEEAYLASAVQGPLFSVPAPEFELAVFLVRMVLKHATGDAMLSLQGALSPSERRELQALTGQVHLTRLWALVREHLPFIDQPLWERCLVSVRPGCSAWFRMRTAGRLERALAGHARRPRLADVPLKVWRRGRAWMRRHVLRRGSPRKTLAHGGALIALVGGDGAGKSTAAEELWRWLSRDFQTARVHLGKPPRSAVSRASRRAWDLGRTVRRPSVSGQAALAASTETSMSFWAYARLAWELMTARDRYRQYVRARRLATNGAIVICDRYPLPQIKLMDGAVATRMLARPGGSRLVRALAGLERRYYGQILYPDILIVLRVDPSVAVERKRGEDDEAFVRRRSQEIWAMDWQGTPAVVVDAGRPKPQVLSEIKSLVWSRL